MKKRWRISNLKENEEDVRIVAKGSHYLYSETEIKNTVSAQSA